jgi:hypothetical protein
MLQISGLAKILQGTDDFRVSRTDIKLLGDELADHSVQTRFDKHAIKCLIKWEALVCSTWLRMYDLRLTV